MALVKPDFSEVQEAVEAGTYLTRIRKGEIGEWPNGIAYINWELETCGEPEAKNNGRRIFAKTDIQGKGAFKTQQIYRAATGQALTGAFDTEQLISRQVIVELVNGVRNGEPTGYTEVKRFRPAT